VIKFLGMRDLSDEETTTMMRLRRFNAQSEKYPRMWQQTRKLLEVGTLVHRTPNHGLGLVCWLNCRENHIASCKDKVQTRGRDVLVSGMGACAASQEGGGRGAWRRW
jgi:hypothetical protein